jgi:hypothetical protein
MQRWHSIRPQTLPATAAEQASHSQPSSERAPSSHLLETHTPSHLFHHAQWLSTPLTSLRPVLSIPPAAAEVALVLGLKLQGAAVPRAHAAGEQCVASGGVRINHPAAAAEAEAEAEAAGAAPGHVALCARQWCFSAPFLSPLSVWTAHTDEMEAHTEKMGSPHRKDERDQLVASLVLQYHGR